MGCGVRLDHRPSPPGDPERPVGFGRHPEGHRVLDEQFPAPTLRRRMVCAGMIGKNSGEGFYNNDPLEG
jgi:hypothetical protein